MAKFNLKKILIQDYEVDLVQATNFEQWVGKNMDYEAVMEKDFKSISFKSSKTNKKDFLKDLKERALKLEPIKSVTDILELFNDGSNKNTELYDKIRRINLELEELKEKNFNQAKKIKDLESKKENVFEMNEAQEKIISEYNGFLRGFNLGFDISGYEKAIGRMVHNRHLLLKETLLQNGVKLETIEKSIAEWRKKQYSNFEDTIKQNEDFEKYENTREELREQFKFIRENKAFVNACMNLKKVKLTELEPKKEVEAKLEQKVEEKKWYNYNVKDLKVMGDRNLFYHYTYRGQDRFSGPEIALSFNYGCISLRYIAFKLGIKCKTTSNKKNYFEVTKEEFLKIYNEKTPKRNNLGELIQAEPSKPKQKSFTEVLNEVGTI